MEGLPAGALSVGPPPRGGSENGISSIPGVGGVGGGPFGGARAGIGNPGIPYPMALSYKSTNTPGFQANDSIPHHYVCVPSKAFPEETTTYMNNIAVGDFVFAFHHPGAMASVDSSANDIVAMNFHDTNEFIANHTNDLHLSDKSAEEIAAMFSFIGVMKNEMNPIRGHAVAQGVRMASRTLNIIVSHRVSARCIFPRKVTQSQELFFLVKKCTPSHSMKRTLATMASGVPPPVWKILPCSEKPCFNADSWKTIRDDTFCFVYIGKASSSTHIDGYGPPPAPTKAEADPCETWTSRFTPNIEIFLRI